MIISFREHLRTLSSLKTPLNWKGEEFTTYQTHDNLRAAADIIETHGYELIDCGWDVTLDRFKLTYRAKRTKW
jgi:hypothetical protein